MLAIDNELKEISQLIKDLKLFSKGLHEIQDQLRVMYEDVKTRYICQSCSKVTDKDICPVCGSTEMSTFLSIQDVTKVRKEYAYSSEALHLLRVLMQTHQYGLQRIMSLSTINLFKDLHIAPNYPIESTYIDIYLLNIVRESFINDVLSIKITLSTFKHALINNNIGIAELQQYRINWKKPKLQINTLSMLFSETNNLESLITNIESRINKLQKSKTLNRIYLMCRRSISFVLDFSQISIKKMPTRVNGKITVTIRNGLDESDPATMKVALSFLLRGIQLYGSADKYYDRIERFLKESLVQLFRNNMELFSGQYGATVSFALQIVIHHLEGAAGFVGGKKMLSSDRFHLTIIRLDRSFRRLEINIQPEYLYECVRQNNVSEMENVLIHEFGHLFDKDIENLHPIRQEAISTFTEFVYGNHKPKFNQRCIVSLLSAPINNEEEYRKINEKWKDATISRLPYWIGEYISYIFYLRLLTKKNPFLLESVNNVQKKESSMKKLLITLRKDLSNIQYAQVVLRTLRTLRNRDFFWLYMRYSDELRLRAVFSKCYAEKLANS